MNSMDDNELIYLMATFDSEEAFEVILNRYKNLIYKFCMMQTRNSFESDDIFQMVASNVWRYRKSYDSTKGQLCKWLITITYNAARKYHKGKDMFFLLEDETTLDEILSDSNEKWRLYFSDLSQKMSPTQYSVLTMKLIGRFSTEEISKYIGLKPARIRQIYKVAIRICNEYFKELI